MLSVRLLLSVGTRRLLQALTVSVDGVSLSLRCSAGTHYIFSSSSDFMCISFPFQMVSYSTIIHVTHVFFRYRDASQVQLQLAYPCISYHIMPSQGRIISFHFTSPHGMLCHITPYHAMPYLHRFPRRSGVGSRFDCAYLGRVKDIRADTAITV